LSRCGNASTCGAFQPKYGEPAALDVWLAEGARWDSRSPNGVALDFHQRLPLSDPSKIRCPTTMAYGSRDYLVKLSEYQARYFSEIAADEKLHTIIPGGAHAVHVHRSRVKFLSQLNLFLSSLSASNQAMRKRLKQIIAFFGISLKP
jgi:pimeloyl-ACP methyl ester carboxylesterase